MNYKETYQEWITNPYFDEEVKAELRGIAEDEKEKEERFYTELEFGTAGLRGIIGAGTNRMNVYTVRKATQGLANYIKKVNASDKGVAIAYDSRRMSPEFADEAALCLAANGIKAYVFESLRPTPELSYAVRKLNCTAGINITASHNPAEYNGYKVYWEDGAQITPPHDTGIMEEVKAVTDYASVLTMEKEKALEEGLYVVIGEEIDRSYMEEIKKLVIHQEAIDAVKDELKIVYTPLHGTGNIPVRRILAELGFTNVYVADLILATDPDADRLGVYVKDQTNGGYHMLTGNMSGCLIADYIIGQTKAVKGSLPKDGAYIRSIVTTNMADAIANYYGVELIEVLTGFKFIGQQILEFERTGKGTYLFGMEESYGCLPGTYARDKDAVAATMFLCEAAAFYKTQGKTLWDAMSDLYERYGYYQDHVESITLKGMEGLEKIKNILSSLRKDPPAVIGGYDALAIRDYSEGIITDAKTKETRPTGLPKSNVLYYELTDDAWVCVRPSGTEPKVKFYIGVKGSSIQESEEQVKALGAAMLEMVEKLI